MSTNQFAGKVLQGEEGTEDYYDEADVLRLYGPFCPPLYPAVALRISAPKHIPPRPALGRWLHAGILEAGRPRAWIQLPGCGLTVGCDLAPRNVWRAL